MHRIANRLLFTGERNASVYFQTAAPARVSISATRLLYCRLYDQWEDELVCTRTDGREFELPDAGVYSLRLERDDGGNADVELSCDDGVTPLLMPGVGVLWNHGAVFPLLLKGGEAHSVWLLSAPQETARAVAVIKGVPFGEDVRVTADGAAVDAQWYPNLPHSWFWHSAELPMSAQCLRFDMPAADNVRFTVYERAVAALEQPASPVRWGALRMRAVDGRGAPIDARFELFKGNERVGMYDRIAGEAAPVYLPEGRYVLRASHGVLWGEAEQTVDLRCGACTEVTLAVEQLVELPAGWVLGELHTHSALEDATLFPRQVMRAARVTGRSFCFMTDKDIDRFDEFGLHDMDEPDVFLGLPGQEFMCHELHTNILNGPWRIDNPEADNMDVPTPGIEQRIGDVVAEYRRMREQQPCLIMHNHPSHRPSEMYRGRPYFRSWWVSDLLRDYELVENCDWQGWFDRLNRGRRLHCAWTGDGHDCTLMYPGKEGVCVYVGEGGLTAEGIIDALAHGRFFSTRAPGAFIDLNVNGVSMGGTAERSGAPLMARVRVEATLPIDRVELYADGRLCARIDGEGGTLDAERELPSTAHWAVAMVWLRGGQWDESTHSFTPHMCAGYDAFTNPVFIGE